LNEENPERVKYKIIYLARHGQGYHNVMESSVGRLEWEAKWARLDGNEKITWADAHLTESGLKQARGLNLFWRDAFLNGKVPTPSRYYTSPLVRCLETVDASFSGLHSPPDLPFKPVVKERLRERFGVHTCDRRNTLSSIKAQYPEYEIEPGFTEEDVLWDPEVRESLDSHVTRMKALLDDVFHHENGTFLSFTTHSGTIRALYLAIRLSDVWVDAGAVVPLLVKAELIDL
jgi:broad specificity phosphatase PhoE